MNLHANASIHDWPEDFSHENGNYLCRCFYCNRVFTGHKRRVVCRECAYSSPKGNFMTVEQIAKVAHEINRAYCQALGDLSQLPWELAPPWQRESAIKGVQFHVMNPVAGPEASHESWMRQKLNDGWVYGAVKDETKKTHPCIVEYDQLPVEQRAKDHLFKAVVAQLLS